MLLIQLESSVEDVIFLSRICSEDSVSELRLQRVYEIQPELRLAKLIRKHRFQEAEKFAKMFNLDQIIILKAKAELILEKHSCTSDDIDNLIKILDSIDDDMFNLQCCLDVNCENLEDVKKILKYGEKILPKNVRQLIFNNIF